MNKRKLFVSFILLFLLLVIQRGYSGTLLYAGESIYSAAGYPCLIKQSIIPDNKPLVVLIPGDANLARIFYGFPGANPKDFLEYWLNKEGYSTLAISYPTDNNVFGKKTYPLFNIHDWAKQAVIVTKKIIQRHHLGHHVILVVWSMGGIITPEYNKIAKNNNLDVVAMSLSATPPIPDLIPQQNKTVQFLKNGLSDRVRLRSARFLKFLSEENHINKKIVIPKKIYLSDFLGNTPVTLLNAGYTPVNKKIMFCPKTELQDSDGLSFRDYPITGIIHGDSASDMQHVIGDQYTWMFLNQQTIYRNYFYGKNLFHISKKSGVQLVNKINVMEANMSCTVRGGHFFFVGQYGAKTTATCINVLYHNITQLQYFLKKRS